MEILSERLRDLRNEKRISLAKLAEQVNVSPSVVFYWEKGGEPTASNLKKLALFFDVSADYLIGLENEDGS